MAILPLKGPYLTLV